MNVGRNLNPTPMLAWRLREAAALLPAARQQFIRQMMCQQGKVFKKRKKK